MILAQLFKKWKWKKEPKLLLEFCGWRRFQTSRLSQKIALFNYKTQNSVLLFFTVMVGLYPQITVFWHYNKLPMILCSLNLPHISLRSFSFMLSFDTCANLLRLCKLHIKNEELLALSHPQLKYLTNYNLCQEVIVKINYLINKFKSWRM